MAVFVSILPFPIPIPAHLIVMAYAGTELVTALATPGDTPAHLAHLGGMLFGYFLIRYWRNNPGGSGYGQHKGQQFFDRMRNSWENRTNRKTSDRNTTGNSQARDFSSHNSDWDYNARQKANQEEVDRILDKIRKSGYESLTREEKQTLFDQSKKR